MFIFHLVRKFYSSFRSLKAISQALALSSNSDLLSTSSFSALLASIQIKEKNVIACFKSTNNKFFYQFFERTGRIFKPKYELKFADENQLIFYFLKKKKDYDDLLLLSSDNLLNPYKDKINLRIKKLTLVI